MATNNKIDENGLLKPNYSVDKSSFFKLLLKNDNRSIEEWLIQKGQLKPYCPIRFISKNKDTEEGSIYHE